MFHLLLDLDFELVIIEGISDGFATGHLLQLVLCSTYWHSYILQLGSGTLASLYPLMYTQIPEFRNFQEY